jgi:hypothetical protein
MIHTFDNSELCILIKLFSIIIAELFDKELTALFFRFSSNYCHSTGIIRQDFVDDIEIHFFGFSEKNQRESADSKHT